MPKTNYNGYMNTHLGFKPFVCKFCSATFGWESQYKQNEKTCSVGQVKCDMRDVTLYSNQQICHVLVAKLINEVSTDRILVYKVSNKFTLLHWTDMIRKMIKLINEQKDVIVT